MNPLPTTSNESIIEGFYAYMDSLGRAPLTKESYRRDVRGMVEWLETHNHWPLSAENSVESALQAYRDHLVESFKPATVNRKLAAIRIFLRWALGGRSLTFSEASKLGTLRVVRPRTGVRWLDPADQVKLLDAAKSQSSPRDLAIVTILLNTGIRLSELCALSWRDVQITDLYRRLIVNNGNAFLRRKIPLDSATCKAFFSLGYKKNVRKSGPIFTAHDRRISRRVVQNLLERCAHSSGIPASPSVLRHTFCRNLVRAGSNAADVAKLAGYIKTEATFHYFDYPSESVDKAKATVERHPQITVAIDDTFEDMSYPDLTLLSASERATQKIERSYIPRDRSVRRQVLKRAGGLCQRCGIRALSVSFLEVHHIIGTDKADRLDNCVALCPNCHREAHTAATSKTVEAELLLIVRPFSAALNSQTRHISARIGRRASSLSEVRATRAVAE